MKRIALIATLLAVLVAAPALAADNQPVGLTSDMMEAVVETPSGPVTIGRLQDNAHVVTGEWAQTSRACPPFCIQPMSPADGVSTIGELELIALLGDEDAVVSDSRTQDWFLKGSIPGAVNIPYLEVVDRLAEFGCEPDFDGWDCTNARKAVLFCNGAWCGQSPTAIRNMISAGFPAERIYYYRGGMQAWRLLGLSVTEPAS